MCIWTNCWQAIKTAILTLSPGNSTGIQKAFDKTGTYQGTPLQYTGIHFTAGIYTINSRMYLNSNTSIDCDPGVYWKLVDNAPNFGEQVPIIGQKESSITGLIVSGIDYFGNYTKQGNTPNDHGLGYGNLFGFKNITDSKFSNITIHDTEGDGFRLEGGSGISIAYCRGKKYGHDFIHLSNIKGIADAPIDISNNYVVTRTNNAVRARSCHYIDIHDNTFIGTTEAYASPIQIESITPGYTSSNINIYNNKIRDALGPGIWITCQKLTDASASKNITVRNNLILNCGQMPAPTDIPGVGGIVCDGWTNVIIQDNTIDGSRGYGILFGSYIGNSAGTGYTATVQHNIITNTVKSLTPGVASGRGIANTIPEKYTVTCEENCYFNNWSGDFFNITDSKAIQGDPRYVGSGDYHLQAVGGHYTGNGYVEDAVSSPCVFEDHELGRYNSTSEASVYYPPPTESCPCRIIGSSAAVIIVCDSAKDASTLASTIRASGQVNKEKVIEYYPKK